MVATGNALAETIDAPYKTELLCRRASWRNRNSVELVSFEWVS